jgi:hypothetical protein
MLESRVRFPAGQRLYAITPTLVVKINQPSIKWIPEPSSKLNNRLGHEDPSITKIQQTLCFLTSTPTISFWEAVIRIRGTYVLVSHILYLRRSTSGITVSIEACTSVVLSVQ